MTYRREIDGLRAVAVLPVIFFHAGFATFGGGFIGVDVFFVISGYLITSILLAEHQAGNFSLLRFYERRARRILPALFLVMAACIPFAWLWLLPYDLKSFSQSLVAVSTFVSNILFWRQDDYFAGPAELKPLLHTWSLAVEEQFYLFFPLFLMLTWRWRKSWVVALLVAGAMMSLALAQWGVLNKPSAAFFLLPTRGWELLMGSLIAFHAARPRNFIHPQSVDHPQRVNQPLAQIGSALGLLLILISVFVFSKNTPFPGLYALVPTIGTALIILCATPATFVGRALGGKIPVGLGLISYSAYLWHQPLFAFAKIRSRAPPGISVFLALTLAAILLAYLSWRFVEMPVRQRRRISRPQIFAFAATASCLFVALGMAGSMTKGFPIRYDLADRDLASVDPTGGPYVGARFEALKERDFDPADKRKKLLVIGDSFSMDLINAIAEAGLFAQLQVSTHYIAKICGNLYLEEDFSNLIAAEDRQSCRLSRWNGHWYKDADLRKRMAEADMIWLASFWLDWQAKLLPKSVANIERDFGPKVLVFGRKSFGHIDLKQLLAVPAATRPHLANDLDAEHIQTNRLLRETLGDSHYIDVTRLLCDSDTSCHLFTADGKLISYEGMHLTLDGAKYFGGRLLTQPLISGMLASGNARTDAAVHQITERP